MLETITNSWRPAKITSNTLLKAGYSQIQLNDIGKIFIERYFNKQLPDASTLFNKMVRTSGNGHNVKPKEQPKERSTYSERYANKSKDSQKWVDKVKAKNIDDGMKLKMVDMIHSRYKTPFDECKTIVELVI